MHKHTHNLRPKPSLSFQHSLLPTHTSLHASINSVLTLCPQLNRRHLQTASTVSPLCDCLTPSWGPCYHSKNKLHHQKAAQDCDNMNVTNIFLGRSQHTDASKSVHTNGRNQSLAAHSVTVIQHFLCRQEQHVVVEYSCIQRRGSCLAQGFALLMALCHDRAAGGGIQLLICCHVQKQAQELQHAAGCCSMQCTLCML